MWLDGRWLIPAFIGAAVAFATVEIFPSSEGVPNNMTLLETTDAPNVVRTALETHASIDNLSIETLPKGYTVPFAGKDDTTEYLGGVAVATGEVSPTKRSDGTYILCPTFQTTAYAYHRQSSGDLKQGHESTTYRVCTFERL